MKKGLYLLIGIFALILLFTNFVSAVCSGTNTASCTASTPNDCSGTSGCQWDDYSSCISPQCDLYYNEWECLEPCIWDYNMLSCEESVGGICDWLDEEWECVEEGCVWDDYGYCSKLSCGELSESPCNGAPGCSWCDFSCGGGCCPDGDSCDTGLPGVCSAGHEVCTSYANTNFVCTGEYNTVITTREGSHRDGFNMVYDCTLHSCEGLSEQVCSERDLPVPTQFCGAGEACSVDGTGCIADYNCVQDVPVSPEICGNGVDDDCDGLTDCLDTSDCPDTTPPCLDCVADCTGLECGLDPVCETLSCGTCTQGTCVGNTCQTISTCDICLGFGSGYGWCKDTSNGNDFCAEVALYGALQCFQGGGTWVIDSVNCPVIQEDSYWADENENRIDTSQTYTYYAETTTLKLVAINLEPETTAVFEIYESDSPFGSDDIRVGASALPTTVVNAEGVAVVNWTISSADIQAGLPSSNDPPFEFYFKVNDNLESDELVAYIEEIPVLCGGITVCSDYDPDSANCNNDACQVAGDSVPSDIACEDGEEYDCYCEWVEADGCGANWDGIEEDPNNPGTYYTIGTCTYITNNSIDPLGCEDDGYLTYGWDGGWTWAPGNEVTQDDPKDKQAQCETSGTSNVLCPAQIELPFFGTWGIIVTIGLIVLIYVVLNMKKQKGKKRKKK